MGAAEAVGAAERQGAPESPSNRGGRGTASSAQKQQTDNNSIWCHLCSRTRPVVARRGPCGGPSWPVRWPVVARAVARRGPSTTGEMAAACLAGLPTQRLPLLALQTRPARGLTAQGDGGHRSRPHRLISRPAATGGPYAVARRATDGPPTGHRGATDGPPQKQ